MDANILHQLFSRDSTPSLSQPQPFSLPPDNNLSSTQINALLHQANGSSGQQLQPSSTSSATEKATNSAPITPAASLTDEPSLSSTSGPTSTITDRQSALLSLLSSAASQTSAASHATQQSAHVATQLRTSPKQSETQGKLLLEQLMSGNAPRSNFSKDARESKGHPAVSSSPPLSSIRREGEVWVQKTVDQGSDVSKHQPSPQTQEPLERDEKQQNYRSLPSATQQSPEAPSHRSMPDFVSPLDHLPASTSTAQKKAVSSSVSSGNDDSSSWTAVSDPKRHSVENLLENLTRGQLPVQAQASVYDQFIGNAYPLEDILPSLPLPTSKPSNYRPVSPQDASSKSHVQRTQIRSNESVASEQGFPAGHAVTVSAVALKEVSPGPRGMPRRGPAAQARYLAKNQSSPSPQLQTIIFDVSEALDEIQAPSDSVKSTAIALVKQDAVFLPGTTIGATHWVAYAMTRGRVRVISRSSGDRTLLQLPSIFSPTSSVVDMAVNGDRLAGVTNDGGFVVWQLPTIITDDVPGNLLLSFPPTQGPNALQSVKWHPKDPDVLGVASSSNILVIDLANTRSLHGQPFLHSELPRIGQLYTASSHVVAFDFDVQHQAISAICEDSTLKTWNMRDNMLHSMTIPGEDRPSSLTFVDGGLVVGRRNGTVFQLLSSSTRTVMSLIKFVSGNLEDSDMFGHVNYDSRMQTLWIANNRRDSMIAFKIQYEQTCIGSEEYTRCFFEQVVEFAGLKPTIHFVILTADADPSGAEVLAACVAAKVPPGELALVAFSVHPSGVDQILIRKEWYDSAMQLASSKLPSHSSSPPPTSAADGKGLRPAVKAQAAAQPQIQMNNPTYRTRTPTSEIDGDITRERLADLKPSIAKALIVNGQDRPETKGKSRVLDASLVNESSLGQTLTREIRKSEENLHSRLVRLIGKELDKQYQRFEEVRANEQVEDFARQEKILKLISTELSRNTTRVVEMAVRNEVQNTVLPVLESITANEVKLAMNEQIGKGFVDFISQSLPAEMEKLVMRPDISNHFTHLLTSGLVPLIERHVRDAIAKALGSLYSQQASSMLQELLREVRKELHLVKNDLSDLQNDMHRNHESATRELEHSVKSLSEQVKYLMTMNAPTGSLHHWQQPQQSHISPPSSGPAPMPGSMHPPHIHGQRLPYAPVAPLHLELHKPWIAAPQPSQLLQPHNPILPSPPRDRSPQMNWDDTFLEILHKQDTALLQDRLSNVNPDIIMPLDGPIQVSQAVILTFIHRLSAVVEKSKSADDEAFQAALPWLQRSVALLNPDDKLISDFIPRVIPQVHHILKTTKQRLSILPGGPRRLDAVKTLFDIQEVVRQKTAIQ